MGANIAAQVFSDARLARHGDAVAIVYDGREVTYRALAALSQSTAATLAASGAAAGERILVQVADTEGQAAAILGAMGADIVPVILSPRLSDDDIAYVAHETGARLRVADDPGQARAVTVSELAGAATAPAEADPREAFWLYSSGTTGRMKGVIHRHSDLEPVLAFHRETLKVGPGVRSFCTSRLSFAYALSNGFLAPLVLGATVILHPDWPSPETTLATAAQTQPDLVFSVPSMYRAWMARPADDLAPMRAATRFVSAGEHLPAAVAGRWRDLTGIGIHDCYGATETCFLIFASDASAKPDSCGFPCAGVETQLRDENGNILVPAKIGTLFITHPFLALGYGPAADASAQARFQDGWFATGDIFRCDRGGHWFHDGREDDWLKVASQWVSLRAVEATAAECAGVDVAAGGAAKDPDGFLCIALLVIPAPDADGSGLAGAVRDHLDESLETFKRPKWVRVVDDLPRTATGKIRKVELRRMIEDNPSRGAAG